MSDVAPTQPKRELACLRPWTGFEIVDHLGDVRPCCWGKVSCGNVNEHRPEEIWRGEGFARYRAKMVAGDTADICSPWCPILTGVYQELDGNAPGGSVAKVSDAGPVREIGLPMPAPKFLKVVPTIACNLKCPMCYQLDEPAARLPGDLFASLEPWIATASELQIMGGEAFVAKQCLDWFRRVDPVRFPRCRLAAITNGLGFTPATCELMALRRWSWILVSIDAASERVYAKTRGGDFGSLLRGLDRLARVRAQSDEGFEIRFGFTLQKSNLKDALPFLDLCATYRALPQFTMVFGDWHGESPLNKRDLDRFLATIEMVDAAL